MGKRILFSLFLLLLLWSHSHTASHPQSEKPNDLATLKATYEAWIKAWNARDVSTIADIASEALGFGRDVPFARQPAADKAAYQRGLEAYLKLMQEVDYEAINTEYKVIGNTGLVWGHYAQTTRQNNGPSRTVYGRQSLTFVKPDGKWKMIFYHRSTLPNEFIR